MSGLNNNVEINMSNKAIVITSTNLPTKGIRKIAETCADWKIIVVADKKTPIDWNCKNVNFLSVKEQKSLDSSFARGCPYNHYARKNVGYIKAIAEGAKIIAETDDDNIPYDSFLVSVNKYIKGQLVEKQGWENVYKYFVDDKIWPRGFPLEYINESFQSKSISKRKDTFDCPIQQYLADGNPDVDAIYRLTTEGEIKFNPNTIIFSNGTFCPFNSQNTIWWPEAYPLLYLPSFVTFRMTDIWRSLIAQICLYKIGKHIAFCNATMFQERNEHSLICDFRDEIPGYLHNIEIVEILKELPLSDDPKQIGENSLLCYKKLVEKNIIPKEELELVKLWLKDLSAYSLNE